MMRPFSDGAPPRTKTGELFVQWYDTAEAAQREYAVAVLDAIEREPRGHGFSQLDAPNGFSELRRWSQDIDPTTESFGPIEKRSRGYRRRCLAYAALSLAQTRLVSGDDTYSNPNFATQF